MSAKFKEPVFLWETCCFVLDQFDASELFGVSKGPNERIKKGFVHPRLKIADP